jgi:hypothetical protein
MSKKIHRGFWLRLRAQIEHNVGVEQIAETVSHELSILRQQEYVRGFNEGFAYAQKRAAENASTADSN